MDEEESTLKLETVKSYLDKKYWLVNIDYRDNLDDSLDVLQKAMRLQEWYPIDEKLDDWVWDAEAESVAWTLVELAKDVAKGEGLELDEVSAFIDDNKEELKDDIFDRDQSNPIHDLLRNTQDIVMLYEVGECIDVCYYEPGNVEEQVKNIKRAWGIKIRDNRWDAKLQVMVEQGDSGELEIYFRMRAEDLMKIGTSNRIRLTDPMIAIVDHWNGSGDNTELQGLEVELPFSIENLYIDKNTRYSYTYEVCGMSSSWCDCTNAEFLTNRRKKVCAK